MWGGHYAGGPASAFAAINPSITLDKRLYAQDIEGSLAHARMLARQKIISASDAKKIEQGLKQIRREIESGKFTFSAALEDIHMHIESALIERLGDVEAASIQDPVCAAHSG